MTLSCNFTPTHYVTLFLKDSILDSLQFIQTIKRNNKYFCHRMFIHSSRSNRQCIFKNLLIYIFDSYRIFNGSHFSLPIISKWITIMIVFLIFTYLQFPLEHYYSECEGLPSSILRGIKHEQERRASKQLPPQSN